MELPLELKIKTEELLYGKKQTAMVKVAKTLTERYSEQSGRSAGLVQTDEEALVYSIVRMPATFGAVHAALSYTVALCDEEISSVADFGAGTGSATWAVLSVFPEASVTCFERSDAMMQIGKSLTKGTSVESKTVWKKHDAVADPMDGKFDLVVASYMLNEMTESDRKRVLNKLWQITGKLLVIVEPGTKVAFSQIRSYRTELEALGASVVAPCPLGAGCPIHEGDWCHFATRIARSKAHRLIKGDAPFEDEKFCYVAFSKQEYSRAKTRVLRHPYVEKSQVSLTLCDGEKISEQKIRKGDVRYKRAQKVKCGDEF